MLTSLHRAIAVSAGVVMLLASGNLASAAFSDAAAGQTISVTTGTVELDVASVDGFPTELAVDGLRPGESRSFAQRLVHAGSLDADARVLVSRVAGSEDGCTSALETLTDIDCIDTSSAGELVDHLELTLRVWPASSAGCAEAPPADSTVVGPLPMTEATGARTPDFRLTPDQELCLRGTVRLDDDAPVSAHGDGVDFATDATADEVGP